MIGIFDSKCKELFEGCIDNGLELRLEAKENIYINFRESITVFITHLEQPENGAIKKPDRHKIGAALALAIMKTLPIADTSDENSVLQVELNCLIPNELLAFMCGMDVAMAIRRAKARQDRDQGTLDKMSHGWKYPPCSTSDYEVHILKSLHYACRKGSFDPFLLAHIFFWLEMYTLEC